MVAKNVGALVRDAGAATTLSARALDPAVAELEASKSAAAAKKAAAAAAASGEAQAEALGALEAATARQCPLP